MARRAQEAETAPLLRGEEASSHVGGDDVENGGRRSKASPRRRRLIVSVVATVIFVVLVVAAIVVAVRDRHPPKGKDDDIPDFTKLPPPQPGLRNPSYLVSGLHGAVASEERRCSELGVKILKDNGTAVDAAIAAALCIGVVNSFSAGIGGGGFMIVRPRTCTHPSGRREPCTSPLAIDFRETAPTGSKPDMFASHPALSKIGGLASGVPGELRGFEAAYKAAGGGVPWKRLFDEVAEIADEFEVGRELARRLVIFGKGWMEGKEEWSRVFLPGGGFAAVGDTIKRPEYAATLRKLGKAGANAFYTGPIAASIVDTVRREGGLLTMGDFANYSARISPALVQTYRNRTFYTSDAPSAGPVLINLLNTLEGFPLPEAGKTGLQQHRFIEALKFAFARRTELGDPSFMNSSARHRIEDIQTKSLADATRANITDDRTHPPSYYDPQYEFKPDHGTTHISTVDRWGSACSLTTTVNLIFGSRVMDPATGIIMNDELDDFNIPHSNAFGLPPSPFNYPRPHKRPLSSTAPVVFDTEDGDVWMALGGSGGSRIFGAIAQVVLGVDWGYDLGHAIEEPRAHDQLAPPEVSIESGYREDLIEALKSRGHNVSMFDINIGIAEVQGVLRASDGRLFAASDSRKNGVAAAF